MSATKSASEIAAPQGMTGIACEPWTPGEIYAVAADWGQASCPVMVWSDDGTFVAAVVHPDIPTAPLDEQEANVPLLIAAPDLLAACKRIYHSYGETSGEEDMNDVQTVTLTVSYEVMAQLAAAIAKAEGRGE